MILLEKLEEKLLSSGLLDKKKLQEALRQKEISGQTLDRVLLGKGLVPEEPLLQLLADFFGYEYLPSLAGRSAPPEFIQKVPVQFARSQHLAGIEMRPDRGVMVVATCTPLDVQPMDDLAAILGCDVEPVVASRGEIAAFINRAYRHKADGVDEALEGIEEEDILGLTAQIEESEDLLDTANKAPIIKLVNMLLFQALKLRASDIHLQPFGDHLQVRMRIDGVLYDMQTIPKKAQEAVISRIKVMGKMDIAERRLPQDGRASIRIGEGDVDCRISSIPSAYGERIVIRILDKTAKIFTLDEIGLAPEQRATLEKYIHYSHGIIFLTGPTGSGKTTTLYAALSAINSKEKNILTIEDPIEYHLEGVSQVQVSTKKGLTFAAGLRSFLRQDPDVMMVGEVRDRETADIAIRAALTGHLVFSTVHTNDSASTVTRMIDIGIEPYLVSSSLILVIAQRLVRLICPHCKEGHPPTKEELLRLEDLGIDPDELPQGKVWRGAGCDECFNSGFAGRTALYEMLPIEEPVREKIMQKASATEIKVDAIKRGLVTLRMDGIRKVKQGLTTMDEVLRVTQRDIA